MNEIRDDKGRLKKGHGFLGGGNKGKHWKVKDISKMKGHTPWNKGKIGRQVSWRLGKKFEYKPLLKLRGRIPWNKGKTGIFSEETMQKLKELAIKNGNGKHRLGKKLSEETKNKIRLKNLGKKHSDKTRKNMIGLHLGEKSGMWQGGKSFEPYTIDWTETLRISIRERDKYTCICGKRQGEIAFSVHHIDYDKKNCNPNNLVTLCPSCHSKTNTNRDYWKNYFSSL